MFNLPQLRLDRLSFWLGFIAASLLWWLLGRIRPLLPVWKEQFRQYRDNIRQKNLASAEVYLRREAVERAQRNHLASPLFSLDEIVIQPWLFAPPPEQDPGVQGQPQSIANLVIPYIPDSPEILVQFGVSRITPAQAAQSGRNIAIIGHPGTGKTIALNHLACQIARHEVASGLLARAVPILTHVLDLDVSANEDNDPLDQIIKGFAGQANRTAQRRMLRFLQAVLRDKDRRLVLLLDGLDELSPEKLVETTAFLSTLHRKYPRLQMIVTASADFVDGLLRLGFYPLGISPWSQAEREKFCTKWGELWQSCLLPDLRKTSGFLDIEPVLYNHWLSAENNYATPLEWTLRIWGAYTGDLSGSRPVSILNSYVARFLPQPDQIALLAELAHHMVKQKKPDLSFNEMEQILSRAGRSQAPARAAGDLISQQAEEIDVPLPAEGRQQRKKSRRNLINSQGEQIIIDLLKGGVLTEHANGQLRFSNLVLLGFLAGMKTSPEDAAEMVKLINYPVVSQTLWYTAARSDDGSWIFPLIEYPTGPLYQNLLIVARWLRDAPSQAAWRPVVMRNLVSLIQNDRLPLSIQARLVNAFYLSRDPATPKLFKQLLSSRSPIIKRAALLGCGALANPQLISEIIDLLADRDSNVRYTACMALAAIPGDAPVNALVEVLLSGDEDLRRASAEALSHIQPDGHKALEEAAAVDDILVRRAAMFGLMQINEPWAKQILEKTAIEDGEWVVRNAAAQALETLQQDHPLIPRPLPPPSESPWLITFASKLGRGILPGQPATDLLLMVLKSGSVEEQMAALRYLRNRPEEGVIRAIYDLLFGAEETVYEPAVQALWWMAVSGAELPDPKQFGLS